MSVLVVLLVLLPPFCSQGSGCAARKQPTVRVGKSQAPETMARYERFELSLGPLREGKARPSPAEVALRVKAPSGRRFSVSGFAHGDDVSVRFTPRELGVYVYELVVRGEDKPVLTGVLRVGEGTQRGFVRRSENNPYQLSYEDGTQVLLLGENRFNVYDPSWNYQNVGIEAYVQKMAESGENALRIFVFTDCEDESRKDRVQLGCLEPNVGHFDENAARRYDTLFEAAERHGVLVILTLFAVGFTPGDVWKGWEDNPYSRVRGGPAETPTDFFESEAARAAALGRLEYVLARWGYSPALLAVDLLNEPEWDGPVGEEVWIAWARFMAEAFRKRDVHDHLITAGPVGLHWNLDGDERPWYADPLNDIVQWHLYGPEVYEVHALAQEITRKVEETWEYERPVLLGEFAYGGEDNRTYDHTHVGLWAATFSGAGVLAHSAPPFSEDSDLPMTPERAHHMRVLRDFLDRVGPVGLPIARSELVTTPSSLSAWALSLGSGRAVWLLAPEEGYGNPVHGAQLTMLNAPCEPTKVELWDDTSGAALGEVAATVSAEELAGTCRVSVALPTFTRHVAARIRTEN